MNRIVTAALLLTVFFGASLYLDYDLVNLDGLPGFNSVRTRLQPVTEQLRTDVEAILDISPADRAGKTLTDVSHSIANDRHQQPTGHGPIADGLEPGQVLLIIASTLSEEAALNHARRLEDRGHKSEVVLSTNGYYGVALGRFSYEQARSMGEVTNQQGIKPPSSYIMRRSSIRSYVYP